MNQVCLIGRLTRDPEIRYGGDVNQTCIARFTVAIDRMKGKDGKTIADFPSCIAFGKTAEIVDKYVHKGDLIGVTGRLQTGSYENKSGQRIYTTDVVIDRVDLISPRDKSAGPDDYASSKQVPAPDDVDLSGFSQLSVDDIPF